MPSQLPAKARGVRPIVPSVNRNVTMSNGMSYAEFSQRIMDHLTTTLGLSYEQMASDLERASSARSLDLQVTQLRNRMHRRLKTKNGAEVYVSVQPAPPPSPRSDDMRDMIEDICRVERPPFQARQHATDVLHARMLAEFHRLFRPLRAGVLS